MMRRMQRGGSHFNIIGGARRWFVVSGVLVAISIGSLGVRGINAGIDFRGGTAIEVSGRSSSVSVQTVKAALGRVGIKEPVVQKVGTRDFRIETSHLSLSKQHDAVNALSEVIHVSTNNFNVTDVGPKWGSQISAKAIRALIIFLFAIVLYLTLRLEFKMGVAGLVALAHDLIITAGIYSLTGFEVTPSTVIALLTILGYSLYDTVVIFDRVKDRTATLSAAGRITYTQAANESLNQVLVRSLNTSIVSLLPVGSLLFVGSFLLGAQTLRELALALFVGITVGTYSSIFVATPLLAIWKEREPRWATLRSRITARGAEPTAPAIPRAPQPARVAAAQTAEPRAAGAAPSAESRAAADAAASRPTSGGGTPSNRAKRRKKKKRRRR